MRFILSLLLISAATWLGAQASLLQSGPMLGYNEMREVLLWVQTTQPAEVQFAYWPTAAPEQRQLTATHATTHADAFAAKLLADAVEPGTAYTYELRINGKPVKLPYPTTFSTQPLWQWRTDPPTFTMAVGSCAYANEPQYDRPGKGYGGDPTIFQRIHEMRPDAMLWLGDNIYLREADWFSRTGILKRYTHGRSMPELQPLLASTHHYAIWDDHDFGPNDSDRSYIHKDKALEAFTLFWGNPTFGIDRQPGTTTAFQWADIDFFLLDNRYYRTPNKRTSGDNTLLGTAQLEWLIDALSASLAPFKLVAVGGQVLNTVAQHENYIHLAPEERTYLLSRIEEEGIKGVVFLTGDRHHTELSQYTNAKGINVYDLTASPLTSGSGTTRDEVNELRVDGTLVVEQNYGMLTFSGPRKERELLIQIFDVAGKLKWERKIAQQ